MRVVTVRLIRNACRRAERDTARHRPAGVIVQDRHVDPVPALFRDLDAQAGLLDGLVVGEILPAETADLVLAVLQHYRRRSDRRDSRVGVRTVSVSDLSPALHRVVQQARGGIGVRQAERIASNATIHLHGRLAERLRTVRAQRREPQRPGGLAPEGMLPCVGDRDRCDRHRHSYGLELDLVDSRAWVRVLPGPQVVVGECVSDDLGLAQPEFVPPALVPARAGIPDLARSRRDLEPFADRSRDSGRVSAGEAEPVLGHHATRSQVIAIASFSTPVRHDDPVRDAVNGNADRFARHDADEARGLGSGRVTDPERQPVEHLVADWRPPAAAERVQSSVARLPQVKRLVIGHVSCSSWQCAGRL